MIEKIPHVEIIKIDDLVFHETIDLERAKRLEEKIRKDGILRNPVIVGKIKGRNKLLLLDGVHRVGALIRYGSKHIVAQIVDYFDENVEVYTWHHLIKNFDSKTLIEKIKDIEGIELEKTNREKADNLLKQKKIVAYLLFENDEVFIVKNGKDLKSKTEKLKAVVDIYGKNSEVCRISGDEIDFTLNNCDNLTAILVIPRYDKEDVVKLAFDKIDSPSGITRHVIPSRILGLDIDLSLLSTDIPIEDKNRLLKEIITERIKNKRTRFYQESVYILNE